MKQTFDRRTFLSRTARVAGGLSLGRAARARSSEVAELVVLHTNDTHSRIAPFDSGKFKGRAGVARRATIFARVKKQAPHVVIADAGDTFQGTSWFNAFKGAVELQVMHALGYDATALGNHDFDAGVDRLADDLKAAPFLSPLLANVRIAPQSPLAGKVRPHVILERGPVRVGMFGLGVAFDGLVNPKLHVGLAYTDPRAAAREQVARLRQRGCHVVIALSHLGYRGYHGEVGDLDWPKDVPGVDYVVGGHTHTFLRAPEAVAHKSGWRTPVMQVGHSGLNVGHATLRVDLRSGRAELSRARPLGVGGAAIT